MAEPTDDPSIEERVARLEADMIEQMQELVDVRENLNTLVTSMVNLAERQELLSATQSHTADAMTKLTEAIHKLTTRINGSDPPLVS